LTNLNAVGFCLYYFYVKNTFPIQEQFLENTMQQYKLQCRSNNLRTEDLAEQIWRWIYNPN